MTKKYSIVKNLHGYYEVEPKPSVKDYKNIILKNTIKIVTQLTKQSTLRKS